MNIYEIHKLYVKKTESHDEVICTGPIINGTFFPANDKERLICKKFSNRVIRFLAPLAASEGYTEQRLRAAMDELSNPVKGKMVA